jgi:hypothetical protein
LVTWRRGKKRRRRSIQLKERERERERERSLVRNWKSEEMDDYTREMMDLKTLVTRTLEKKGVLARIRVRLLFLLSILN